MAEKMVKTGDSELCFTYKRRLVHESSVVPEGSSSSNVSDDFSAFEFPSLDMLNEIGSSEEGLDGFTEELELGVREIEDWKDPMANQLEELLMSNLEIIFSNAIKQVVDLGYSKEEVVKVLSRKSLYLEGDPVTNIVYHTVSALNGTGSEPTSDIVFENFQQLLQFTLAEMIGVLRELNPSLSETEAMWKLLMNNLCITQAIGAEDQLSDDVISSEQSSDKSSILPLKPEVQSSDTISDSSVSTSQKGSQESKSGSNSKLNRRKELASALRQKFLHIERTKACGKGGVKLAKLTTSVSGLIVEQKVKTPSEKHGSSNTKGVSVSGKGVATAGGSTNGASTNDTSALPEGGSATKLPTKDAMPPTSPTAKTTRPKPMLGSSDNPKVQSYFAGIPFDEASGNYVPRDEKEGDILKLAFRVQELQDELQGWNDWTMKKVMQVAEKLRKHQAESKALKKETEEFRKERKTLEENAEKRISEVQNAMENNKRQLENATSGRIILETKKSLLQKELKNAKSLAEKSAKDHQQALKREKKAIQQAQSWETEKGMLQDELQKEKQKLSNLQQEIEKGKLLLAKTEGRAKKERAKTEELLAQAAYLRKEREKSEALMRAEEEVLRKKTADELQRYVESKQKITKKMDELRLKSGSKISTLSMAKEIKKSEPSTTGSCQDKSARGKLKQEYECVMCLEEESSVLFLPCSHQVLCPSCNEIHEKKGMKDCPSCRTLIVSRIHAKFLGMN